MIFGGAGGGGGDGGVCVCVRVYAYMCLYMVACANACAPGDQRLLLQLSTIFFNRISH